MPLGNHQKFVKGWVELDDFANEVSIREGGLYHLLMPGPAADQPAHTVSIEPLKLLFKEQLQDEISRRGGVEDKVGVDPTSIVNSFAMEG